MPGRSIPTRALAAWPSTTSRGRPHSVRHRPGTCHRPVVRTSGRCACTAVGAPGARRCGSCPRCTWPGCTSWCSATAGTARRRPRRTGARTWATPSGTTSPPRPGTRTSGARVGRSWWAGRWASPWAARSWTVRRRPRASRPSSGTPRCWTGAGRCAGRPAAAASRRHRPGWPRCSPNVGSGATSTGSTWPGGHPRRGRRPGGLRARRHRVPAQRPVSGPVSAVR